jgi:hypothetical protein
LPGRSPRPWALAPAASTVVPSGGRSRPRGKVLLDATCRVVLCRFFLHRLVELSQRTERRVAQVAAIGVGYTNVTAEPMTWSVQCPPYIYGRRDELEGRWLQPQATPKLPSPRGMALGWARSCRRATSAISGSSSRRIAPADAPRARRVAGPSTNAGCSIAARRVDIGRGGLT